MSTRKIKHLISNLRRHYNLQGQDILTCYDTAFAAIEPDTIIQYVTVSVSPSNWKKLSDLLPVETIVKHPGSNVECLKLFDELYVRKETRVADDNVMWLSSVGCYTPTKTYLVESLAKVVMAKASTKKQITHANSILKRIKVNG